MIQTKTKTCEKKLKIAELKILKIVSKINSLKLNDSDICQLDVVQKKGANILAGVLKCRVVLPVAILILVSAVWWLYLDLSTKKCLLAIPSTSKTLFRPPEDCSMCAGVDSVTRVANISAREFEDLYAYNTIPVIVTDATQDWKAVKEFSFEFFREFYQRGSLGRQTSACSFFAYNSGLRSLADVFAMDEQRANLSGAPWYVGWSTCFEAETAALRGYYSRPYFLPPAAESDAVDWLFMGGPGQGAHMHVDSVRHVSWQAQVRGRKRWQLAPPPECLYACRQISFTVAPHEILVVDTNRWYHRTTVLPGDISITIGAEYD
ncbi:uncharacterized protein isoform X1 [Choristoneura fumiferana]|uniref:uncharacterized protein isoform X1 n=1 Tax=Choristoneura fumiferana TaxID=7141 RepID=UPI003D156740